MSETVLIADGQAISGEELVNVVRRSGQLANLLREWVLDKALVEVSLEEGEKNRLLSEFRQNNGLEGADAFSSFLQQSHLNEELLRQSLSRPLKVMRYREERWGPRANSLYLQHKDRYDRISYRRLQSIDADVMQEVYFRLKDAEETWESLSRQFYPGDPLANGLKGPMPVADVEPELLDELRRAGPNKLLKPLQIGQDMVVAQLVDLLPAEFNDELRSQLLRDAFDAWVAEECSRMLSKLEFPQ